MPLYMIPGGLNTSHMHGFSGSGTYILAQNFLVTVYLFERFFFLT